MTIEAAAVPLAPTEAIQTQNLFEHAASNAGGLPHGAGPGQLGGEMMQNLQGFIERSGSLADRARGTVDAPPSNALVSLPSDQPMPTMPVRPEAPAVSETQMDRAIQSLGVMFDHAIETQLVVRGSTQVAGAANTLLRGQ